MQFTLFTFILQLAALSTFSHLAYAAPLPLVSRDKPSSLVTRFTHREDHSIGGILSRFVQKIPDAFRRDVER